MTRRKDNKGRVLKEGETQRKDGTYMYRYYDTLHKRRAVYAKTLDELRAKEEKVLRDVSDFIITSNATLNDIFEASNDMNQRLSEHARKIRQRNYNAWIGNTWLGHKQINRIVMSDVMRFYKEKKNSGLSDATIQNMHTFINRAFEFAVEDNLIRKNCAKDCALPYNERGVGHALSREDVDKFLATAESLNTGKRYLVLVKIMLYEGLRVGEATGLTWKDIDFKNRLISVNHQFSFGDESNLNAYHMRKPKTKTSIRKVPMSNVVYDMLKEWKKETYKKSHEFGIEIDGYTGFVVCSQRGLPVQRANVSSYINRITKLYNSTHVDQIPHISSHMFRHTFCTRLFEYGINPKALQLIMGHASYATTFNIYVNINDEFTQKEFQKVDDLMYEELKKTGD